ncbi:MAG: LuxR C-terminal-related transcriptional regulator [Dyadobacter sp.]|uniref:LuxR C-terminal-related transcriptional regulator n=1 Tax=Dyadobacter sp. TaxID=1914288 RepID=UPI0032655D2C
MRRNTDLSLGNGAYRHLGATRDYIELLNDHFDFDGIEPDCLDKQLDLIRAMAQLSSSGVTVYDLQKGVHVYASRNFYQIYGYELGDSITDVANEVFDCRIHPTDREQLARNGYEAMQFMMTLPSRLRRQFKMVTEYRIFAGQQGYIQVTEQHQVLEQDASGNIWLSLGIIDVSPNQSDFTQVKFQITNFHTGELVQLQKSNPSESIHLTFREKEILEMIGKGKLSKEISSQLEISIHTVNTHRQRILEKLEVNNSIEALYSAKRLGIIA